MFLKSIIVLLHVFLLFFILSVFNCFSMLFHGSQLIVFLHILSDNTNLRTSSNTSSRPSSCTSSDINLIFNVAQWLFYIFQWCVFGLSFLCLFFFNTFQFVRLVVNACQTLSVRFTATFNGSVLDLFLGAYPYDKDFPYIYIYRHRYI